MHRTRTSVVAGVVVAVLTAAIALVATLLLPSPANAQVAGTGTGYLRTDGNRIVDATGATVRLTGVNWFGMETDNLTFHGLWANPPATWRGQLDRMAELGFNTLRIPYTGEALRPNARATSVNSYTNPDLLDLHPLEILDRVIEYAGGKGMRVILDRHRPSTSGQHYLWYTPAVSERSMIDDWVMLARRYAGNPTVVGADLFNEPHAAGTLPDATGACWGCGDPARDWRLAAERIGNAILAVAPNWLIVVEGVSCPTGGLPNGWDNDPATDDDCTWWGGNLSKAGEFPVRLDVANRLVYSPHDYAISVYDRQRWFDDPTFPNNLPAIWDHYWGYLHQQEVAPILLGEFGTTLQHPLDRQWLPALMDYLTERGMSFTYWSWNPNSGDTGGIVKDDWWTLEQAKYDILRPHLVPPVPAGGPGPTTPPAGPTGSPGPTVSPSPTGSPTPGVPAGCAAEVTVGNAWQGGFQAEIIVSNTGGGAVSPWTISFTLPAGASVGSGWNGTFTQVGTEVTVRAPAWSPALPAGGTVAVGFVADGPASPPPAQVQLAGVTCATG